MKYPKPLNLSHAQAFKPAKRQRGNYLLSIGIGIMVMAILSVWGIPKIQDYLIEGAVPSVAEESQRFISRLKVNTSGTGTTPYTGVDQGYLARAVRGSSLQVQSGPGGVAGEGTGGTTVLHGLGGGTGGTITLTTIESGAAFTLTFANVNHAACPSLSTALQRSVDDIRINGSTVKLVNATTKNVTTGYIAGAAASACNDGDTNSFVFTVR
ncbi:type 4 pilus major pilin [Stutzerimonas stutzeri]